MTDEEVAYGKHKLHIINVHTPHMRWWPWDSFYSYAKVRVTDSGLAVLQNIGGVIEGEKLYT